MEIKTKNPRLRGIRLKERRKGITLQCPERETASDERES